MSTGKKAFSSSPSKLNSSEPDLVFAVITGIDQDKEFELDEACQPDSSIDHSPAEYEFTVGYEPSLYK